MTMNGTAAVGVDAPEVKLSDVPKKLTAEERLQIENIYLKVENMRLQTERLQSDVVQAVQLRQQYQGEMAALQTRLAEKYGVDMTKVKILPDGTILPQG
jgi:ABC-type phosphate transport system auxiliary subunit